MKMHARAAHSLTGLVAVLATFAAETGRAATTEIAAAAAANVQHTVSGFSLFTNPFTLTTQQLIASNIDSRVVIEFPLASLNTGGEITAASLNLNVNLHSSPGGALPVVPVFGYVGNGTAALADATINTNLIGITAAIPGTGPISIPLSLDYLSSLVGTATHLGVLLVGSANGAQAGFDNLTIKPKLTVTVSDTAPGDFDADGDVDGHDFLSWQIGDSPDPLSQTDLDEWAGAYPHAPALVPIAAVPEPTTLAMTFGALTALAAARSRRNLPTP